MASPDADMLVFTSRLRNTGAGKAFVAACMDMRRADGGIRTARNRLELRVWQRQYIRASERATRALMSLERDYGWPP